MAAERETGMTKHFLFELPDDLDDSAEASGFFKHGHDVELRVVYRRNQSSFLGVLRFVWVRAIRYSAEPVATSSQITDNYGVLTELENSEWIKALVTGKRSIHLDLTHFMIYVPDVGSYEFAAESWTFEESPLDQ